MNRVRVGIVGFGGFGQFLRRSWDRLPTVQVVAVADESPAVNAEGLSLYRDWRALMQDPGVDLVAVATPPASHAEIACAALEAGKHVLVEKPLATTREDALRIIDASKRSGRVATVDYMLRFDPIVELLHRWARTGPFGRLRRVLVENHAQDETLPRQHWFWDRSLSGGILVEHSVHFIDLVSGCTDAAPASVDGFAVNRDDGRTDRMGMTVLFGDGLVMTQYHAFARPGFFETTSMRFTFDLADVEVEGWIPLSGRIRALVSARTEDEVRSLPGLEILRREDVSGVEDESRPAGWGASPTDSSNAGPEPPASTRLIRSGGEEYDVSHLVEAQFALPDDKSTVYANCLRSLMSDVVSAIHDPDHALRVTLDHGLASLDVALRATRTDA
ncbi:MAG TPA: Gfo/Idh/MocA family oxidoreductase [Rhodothermales bacterium]